MGKPTGFIEYGREVSRSRDPRERTRDFRDVYEPSSPDKVVRQAARCMDCGVPFCHQGCPLGNLIPEFNDAVYQQNWAQAWEVLTATNNFPEFTGRICPAPCEGSCVLGINSDPVAIELVEKTITETAYSLNLVKARPPQQRTGRTAAVIGSGPAGLAAAAQLNAAGHTVTVYERSIRPGGLLRYGVPDFKLEKWVIDRRISLMEQEGITFVCGIEIGRDLSFDDLRARHEAVIVCTGAEQPREMDLPGRHLTGVHLAMDYLTLQNQQVAGEWTPDLGEINARDKQVIVLGGGDTGSDCIGTANRQGAARVTQLTWGPKPPAARAQDNPWPEWPMVLQSSSSHEEGCERHWSVLIKGFVGDETGKLTAIRTARIQWHPGRKGYDEVAGSTEDLPCDLALIAVGFSGVLQAPWLTAAGLATDARGNLATKQYHTEVPGVFAAGDARRGQSLVVWAISEGREAARAADTWLMGTSALPSRQTSLVNVSSWV
ncbi:MAG: glutamate synthase subunit beta [Bacteroidia bacterium]|nr:glutamate synthase subunit beta [Bacteroidia bacterium]